MRKFIKLYEEFIDEASLNKFVEVTFRFSIKEGINPETIKNKLESKFIQTINPPFYYDDLVFKGFEIDFIGDIEEEGRIESEFAIKSEVNYNSDEIIDLKLIERQMKVGIEEYLQNEVYALLRDEVESIDIIEYQSYEN
jgi:hypothetical protein